MRRPRACVATIVLLLLAGQVTLWWPAVGATADHPTLSPAAPWEGDDLPPQLDVVLPLNRPLLADVGRLVAPPPGSPRAGRDTPVLSLARPPPAPLVPASRATVTSGA
jgi:hypothetical protein